MDNTSNNFKNVDVFERIVQVLQSVEKVHFLYDIFLIEKNNYASLFFGKNLPELWDILKSQNLNKTSGISCGIYKICCGAAICFPR